MNQGLTKYKPVCNESTILVAAKKIVTHVAAHNKIEVEEFSNQPATCTSNPAAKLEELLEENNINAVEGDDGKFGV